MITLGVGLIYITWFSKELKNNLSKNNCLRGVILILLVRESIFVGWGSPFPIVLVSRYKYLRGVIFILLVRESIFVGWGSPFPIVLVSRYKLSLCHTPIKPYLLGFPGIGLFAWPCDHDVRIMRFVILSLNQCFSCRITLFMLCLRHIFWV